MTPEELARQAAAQRPIRPVPTVPVGAPSVIGPAAPGTPASMGVAYQPPGITLPDATVRGALQAGEGPIAQSARSAIMAGPPPVIQGARGYVPPGGVDPMLGQRFAQPPAPTTRQMLASPDSGLSTRQSLGLSPAPSAPPRPAIATSPILSPAPASMSTRQALGLSPAPSQPATAAPPPAPATPTTRQTLGISPAASAGQPSQAGRITAAAGKLAGGLAKFSGAGYGIASGLAQGMTAQDGVDRAEAAARVGLGGALLYPPTTIPAGIGMAALGIADATGATPTIKGMVRKMLGQPDPTTAAVPAVGGIPDAPVPAAQAGGNRTVLNFPATQPAYAVTSPGDALRTLGGNRVTVENGIEFGPDGRPTDPRLAAEIDARVAAQDADIRARYPLPRNPSRILTDGKGLGPGAAGAAGGGGMISAAAAKQVPGGGQPSGAGSTLPPIPPSVPGRNLTMEELGLQPRGVVGAQIDARGARPVEGVTVPAMPVDAASYNPVQTIRGSAVTTELFNPEAQQYQPRETMPLPSLDPLVLQNRILEAGRAGLPGVAGQLGQFLPQASDDATSARNVAETVAGRLSEEELRTSAAQGMAAERDRAQLEAARIQAAAGVRQAEIQADGAKVVPGGQEQVTDPLTGMSTTVTRPGSVYKDGRFQQAPATRSGQQDTRAAISRKAYVDGIQEVMRTQQVDEETARRRVDRVYRVAE
jgi:hypothetical protein